jgi:hypothetical protein
VAAALGLGLLLSSSNTRTSGPAPTHFAGWLVHAALLTGLVAALAVGRAAAAVLLDMASRATTATAQSRSSNGGGGGKGAATAATASIASYPCSPQGLRRVRELAGQVVAPWVGAALLSYGMQAGLPFPSDARLPFNVCALGAVGLHLLTLQLRVRLAGDWGSLGLDAHEAVASRNFRFERRGR